MAAFKIKKISRLRKRFIESEALESLESWFDVSEKLKDKILTDSTFQVVGDKTIVAVDSKSQIAHVLVEVLGIPQAGLKILDQEPSEMLQYICPETPFEMDFTSLKARAADLMSVINHQLEERYYIVSDGLNLELHFFIQKDYIHS